MSLLKFKTRKYNSCNELYISCSCQYKCLMGQLKKHAEAINEEAYERLDNIEETWLKKHMTGKKKTFMEQLYLRNQARAMAEEIVINEIVFKCR